MLTIPLFSAFGIWRQKNRREAKEPERYIDFTIDLIELPYWISFHSDKKSHTLKAFRQGELYTKDEEKALESGCFIVEKASCQSSGKATSQELLNCMPAFYFACLMLNCLIQSEKLEPLYAGLDPAEAGILLTAQKDKLSWKVVSARERPSLTVQTLFGETTVGRPYMEDFWERSMLDSLDLEETIDEIIDAAEEGDEDAMEALAQIYLNGDEDQDIEPDPAKCVYWLTKLAETGDATAMYNLGLHYVKGHGVQRDFVKAVEWMEKAAEAGDEDVPETSDRYRKLANAEKKATSGDAQAQADLANGLMELGGSLSQAGVGSDYAESVKWAKLAAAQNNADAMWVLALSYEHGRGVKRNIDTALAYYKRGAELGNAACQHSLGCYYMRGDHLKKDSRKAVELFKKICRKRVRLCHDGFGQVLSVGPRLHGQHEDCA